MSKLWLRGTVRAEDLDEDGDDPIPFTIATAGRKADGLDLQMDRLRLDRYLANPVIGYGHNFWGRENLPIGRGEDVTVDGDVLLASARFDLDDPFAAQVDRKYRRGFLNAVSVGFDVGAVEDETGIPDWWELHEFSAVPIPLDPDAVTDMPRARAAELAAAIDELREGKVLSKANKSKVEDAIAALQSLLAAAEKADDDDTDGDDTDDDDRSGRSIDTLRRRLQLAAL